jgi:hypothetical protein
MEKLDFRFKYPFFQFQHHYDSIIGYFNAILRCRLFLSQKIPLEPEENIFF